jgi:hypothetical protein
MIQSFDNRKTRIDNFYRISALNDIFNGDDSRRICIGNQRAKEVNDGEPQIVVVHDSSKDGLRSGQDELPRCPIRLPTGSFSHKSSTTFDFIDDECSFDLDDISYDILNASRRILLYPRSPVKNIIKSDASPINLGNEVSQNHPRKHVSSPMKLYSTMTQPSLVYLVSKQNHSYSFDDFSSCTFEDLNDSCICYCVDGNGEKRPNLNFFLTDKKDVFQSDIEGTRPPFVPRRRSSLSSSDQTTDSETIEQT